jgi:hypothetical protein
VKQIMKLAEDPETTDAQLAPAIAVLRDKAREELIAAWQPRVAARDQELITRLLGLFEQTALTATDPAQLVTYIHALLPAGGHEEVYAHVEQAIASANAAVRTAVCSEWLGRDAGARAFDDAQIDLLARSAVALAEMLDDSADRAAALAALAGLAHPGARRALIDGVRNSHAARHRELRRHLYRGLGHIVHPDVTAFVVERLFVEPNELVALGEAIVVRIGTGLHAEVLAALARRSPTASATRPTATARPATRAATEPGWDAAAGGASARGAGTSGPVVGASPAIAGASSDPNGVRAAVVYVDALLASTRAPRLVVEVAREVLAWQPATNDDARRLRYLFEQATLAALATHRHDDARALATRARELPPTPYSDVYVIDRDTHTPSPFATPEAQAQLAALDAQSAMSHLVVPPPPPGAPESIPVGEPDSTPDDRWLATLAGSAVVARLLDDATRGIVWFVDAVGELHVFEGRAVKPMTLATAGVDGKLLADPAAIATFLSGQSIVDERAVFVDVSGAVAREIQRLGARLVIREHSRVIGLRFGSYTAARSAAALLAANPPPGTHRRTS